MVLNCRQIAVAAFLLLAGCAAQRPSVWRVEGQMLAPPGRPRPILVKSRGPCPQGEAITARRKGGRTRVVVNGEGLARQAPGWLSKWTWQAEESGCIPAGAAADVAERVLDMAPLGLRTRHNLVNPNNVRGGYVDLGPANQLQVITPVLRPGTDIGAATSGDSTVTGTPGGLQVEIRTSAAAPAVEIVWYAVRQDRIEPLGEPRSNLFDGLRGHFFRLVYKADQSSIMLTADTRREMEEAMRAMADSFAACARCLAIPRHVGLNPYLAVPVNGREVRVTVGSTLRTVIQAAGRTPDEVMPTLELGKSFAGRMTPVQFQRDRADVLDLVLEGNEIVRW